MKELNKKIKRETIYLNRRMSVNQKNNFAPEIETFEKH